MGRTEEWRQERMQVIENSKSLPPQERIPILGSVVTAGYPDRMMPPNEIQLEVAAKARAALLAIPGHAEYYRDRILKARAAYDEPSDEKIRHLHEWIGEQEGFRVLALLPSVENVRVLGEFLADDRGKIGGPGPPPVMDEGRPMESANSGRALQTLHALPLVRKPVASEHVYPDKDLEAYRLWYAQIKSGKRTFRFEGDPTEYDLDGPAPPEKLRRIAEHRVRDAARAERTRPDDSAASSAAAMAASSGTIGQPSATLAAILALAAALAAAGWYLLRKRTDRAN